MGTGDDFGPGIVAGDVALVRVDAVAVFELGE